MLQKIRHPLAGGDDIKCQTVDQHQGEICKMRVSTAKRAQNALANVHVCVCVSDCAYAHFCRHFHLCNACPTHTHTCYPPPPSPPPLPLLILALISLSSTRFACRSSTGQWEWTGGRAYGRRPLLPFFGMRLIRIWISSFCMLFLFDSAILFCFCIWLRSLVFTTQNTCCDCMWIAQREEIKLSANLN